MNTTVELDTSGECSRCDDDPELPDDSSVYRHGMMDDSSYDDSYYDDSYYDLTDTIDDGYEGSSHPPASELIETTDLYSEDSVQLIETDTRDREEIAGQPSSSVDIHEETLEENNNDPNNNMDSIQISFEAPAVAAAAKLPDEPRVPSPMPGCSKDSVLLPDNSHIAKMVMEQTRHVLGLVSRIHHDSVFEARLRDWDTPVSELRLWDLIPEAARLEFPDNILTSKKSKITGDISTKSSQVATNPSNQTATIKRGPDEDLCTIGCKRSSSTPDMSLSVPMVTPTETPKVPSISQIATVPKIIPDPAKILPVPFEQLKSKSAPVAVSELPLAVSTPKVVQALVTVGHGAITKTRTEGPRCGNQAKAHSLPLVSSTSYSGVGQPTATLGDSRNVKFASPVATVSVYQTAMSQVRDIAGQWATMCNGPIEAHCTSWLGCQEDRQNSERTWRFNAATPKSHLPQYKSIVQPTPDYAPQIEPLVRDLSASLDHSAIDDQATMRTSHEYVQEEVARMKHTVAGPLPAILINNVPATANIQSPLSRPARPAVQQQTQPAARQQIQRANHQQIWPPDQREIEDAKKVVCMEIYYKLINIFPNVDRTYVKKLCPAEWGPGDRDSQLTTLVDMILEGGDEVPKVVGNDYGNQEETDVQTSSPDDVYENLLGIFPDADPHFLRDFAEKHGNGPETLKQFVERNLEQRDYPTREQYMARLKITEQQRQYTHGFDVKQYLLIIPDPAKYFTDPKRRCENSTVAFEFLKSHFNKMKINTISRIYKLNHYNMTLTAEFLERLGPELRSKRCGMEMPTENILLLQEMAYLKHKTKITDYVANAKKAEENEFKMFKAQNLLLECQCCFDAECVPTKCCNCENGHIFCNECVINGTTAKLGDGDTHINCFIDCGSEFSLSVLQGVLAPTTFSILLKKRQAAEVIEAEVEGLVSCPFCHFASIPPEEDKIFRCLNPECTKESCRLCKELSHVPLKCDEVMKSDKARLYIEEKMTAALARTCYKCQKSFFKEEGCNKITCVCGAKMCYLCDKPIKDYSHFRGQGSDDQSRCPLYSDTIRLDAVAVRKVAEQAKLEVLKQDPNIRIETRNLLPAIPRPQRGPHEEIPNADELPRRAQRIIDLPPM